MKQASLTHHMRPFSHVPGEACLIPRSSWLLTAYPTRFALRSLALDEEKIVVSLNLRGPVKNFTLMQDLERDFVRIFGISKEGYFSFRVTAHPDQIVLLLERCPKEGLTLSFSRQTKSLKRKETLSIPFKHHLITYPKEKIHFGCHKKQDWTLMKRRLSLKEILPFWFALGCKYPQKPLHFHGAANLLKECQIAIEKQDRLQIGPLLLNLFQVGFKGILIPQLIDGHFQGILPYTKETKESPFILLSYGAQLIRQLFIQHEKNVLSILPCLPVELHAGQCRKIEIDGRLLVDLEWSKKMIRRLIIFSSIDQVLKLELQKELKSFRLEGRRYQKGTLIELKSGKTYLFDRFEK